MDFEKDFEIFCSEALLEAEIHVKRKGRKIKFSQEEDEALKKLFSDYGHLKTCWVIIGERMGRTPRECRERWKCYLDPTVSTKSWTKEEDELLCKKVVEFGTRWNRISAFFKNRTDVMLKNRYNQLTKKIASSGFDIFEPLPSTSKKSWTMFEDMKLAETMSSPEFVDRPFVSWRAFAEKMPGRSAADCCTRRTQDLKLYGVNGGNTR